MKTFNTVLLVLLVLFLLSFATFEILDISVSFTKGSEQNVEQNDNLDTTMQNQNQEAANNNPFNLPDTIDQLMAQILTEGTGDEVAPGDKITVHYSGYLTNGTKFDSSVDRGTPFPLTIGVGQVIPGWDQGVIGMKVGETRRLVIPSTLAYGEQGVAGAIPPNSPLVFDVQLVSIDEKAPAQEGEVTTDIPAEEIPAE